MRAAVGYVTSTGPLTTKSSGRVFGDGGRHYIDETARRNLLSRLPHERDGVSWRDQAFRFPEAAITSREGQGALYVVTPENGRPEGELARAFVEELVLHRIATRATFRATRPQPSSDSEGDA